MSMSADLIAQSLAYYLTTGTVAARPTSLQISLHGGPPDSAGAANEITDSAYVRRSITFGAPSLANPDYPITSNSAPIQFPAAAAGYTVTHVVIWDQARGTPLVIQRLLADKTVPTGTQAQIATGEIKVGGVI
jgi:hypothetical protein